jgi:DNA-binding response OmpR family regulator
MYDANLKLVENVMTKTRILLVEDDKALALMVSKRLEAVSHEYQVEVRGSAFEAIEYIKTNPPDTVLLDLGLPDSNGINTFYMVIEYARNIPVIVLSAIDDPDVMVQCVRGGAQDYIIKGKIDPQNIITRIQSSIARHEKMFEKQRERRANSKELLRRFKVMIASGTPAERVEIFQEWAVYILEAISGDPAADESDGIA